jgi:hypothetical protein
VECDIARVGISQEMDGELLPSVVIAAVDAHTDRCPGCASFRDRAHRVRAAVRIHEAEPVPDLVAPIMAAVRAEAAAKMSRPSPPASPDPASAIGLVEPPREGVRTPHGGAAGIDQVPAGRRREVATTTPRPPPSVAGTRVARLHAHRGPRFSTVAAALIAGLVVGSAFVGGPFTTTPSTPRQPALAAPLGEEVLTRAAQVQSLQAGFQMLERHFAPDVPARRFRIHVQLHAPEQFHLTIRDRSDYPRDWASPPNDLSYIVNRGSSYSSGPTACPSGLGPSCPQKRTIVTNRSPFSSTSPVPTDLVLPLTTLGGRDGISSVPGPTILGRQTREVELPYEQAAALFPFLQLFPTLQLGDDAWRPYFYGDRVQLLLDDQTLFPLRSEIFAASGRALERDRRAWEQRFGLPKERAGKELLSIQATSFDDAAHIPAQAFKIPHAGAHVDEGADGISLDRAARRLSFSPATVGKAAGLQPYRAVSAPAGDGRQTVVAYARGISWLKIGEARDWSEPQLFGVDPTAEQVDVAGVGVGYFEPGSDFQPGSDSSGRRLAIHTPHGELLLETNLPRTELLHIAELLPVTGRPIPRAWRVQRAGGVVSRRVPLDEAIRAVRFEPRLPMLSQLPAGYVVASAELTRAHGASGITVLYRQTDSDLAGAPIRVHEEPARSLADPLSSATRVRMGGDAGLFDPGTQLLQWIHHGVYYSIDSPDLELPALIQLGLSLRPAQAP